MPEALDTALAGLKRDEVLDEVRCRLTRNEDPLEVLDECRRGMAAVGKRFQDGEYFLSELLLAAEIFKEAAAILEPYLAQSRPPKPLGSVVLATMKGDIHDLGKNIFATLLRARGFELYDAGVDVAPAVLVRKVEEIRPDFVGFSALLTTAFASMKEAADLLAKAGLRDRLKLLIGGGVTTPAVKEYVGADFQTTDAAAGVTYCCSLVKASEHGG